MGAIDWERETLLGFARARSAMFAIEGLVVPAVEWIVRGERPPTMADDPKLFARIRVALDDLLRADVARIERGLYPRAVLAPESPIRHLARMPELLWEGVALSRRRLNKNTREFAEDARERLRDVPEYYRRNFHFQADGYLSGKSARLYEHQVEVLFAGGADAMRRLIIEPMKAAFGDRDGAGLAFLELGAGTGRATRFVRMAFPKARIVAIDLSAPYLKRARRELESFERVDFLEADAEKLPFQAETFDAVYSTFLFHETPLVTRKAILAESTRVLKPAGFQGWVDSIQRGDQPEFDVSLENFPVQFHEPFYKNYAQNPMEGLAREAGLENVESEVGFFSKRVSGFKAAAPAKAPPRKRNKL